MCRPTLSLATTFQFVCTLGHSRVPILIIWSNSPCRFFGMLWVGVYLHHLLPSHLQLSEFWSRMCGLIWNFPGRKAAQTCLDIAEFFFLQVWWFWFWSNNCHQSRERNSRRTLLSPLPEGCGSCRNPPINVMASQLCLNLRYPHRSQMLQLSSAML